MRRYLSPCSTRTSQRGFSLMELMVVLAVAGVILGLAIPNMREFILNNRLTGDANDLLAAFNLARTEAVKRQLPVVICATADTEATPPVCSGGWAQGASSAWIVFVDADGDWIPDNNVNEPVLARNRALDGSIRMVSDQTGRVKYLMTGFASPPSGGFSNTTAIGMCDHRGLQANGTQSMARGILIHTTGRVRVTRLKDEVNAIPSISTVCP
jgi:type IV fimbrial biogenesis protein FimT